MHVAEPKMENSGIPQGVFIKRHRIPKASFEIVSHLYSSSPPESCLGHAVCRPEVDILSGTTCTAAPNFRFMAALSKSALPTNPRRGR